MMMQQSPPAQGHHSYSSRSRNSTCCHSSYSCWHLPSLQEPTTSTQESQHPSYCLYCCQTANLIATAILADIASVADKAISTKTIHSKTMIVTHIISMQSQSASILVAAVSIKLWTYDFISHHNTPPTLSFLIFISYLSSTAVLHGEWGLRNF